MILALHILLWILAGLLALALVVLVVPVHVRGRGSVKGLDADGQVQVRWGWGFFKVTAAPGIVGEARLLGLSIWKYRPKTPEEIEKEKQKQAEREKKQKEKAQRKKEKARDQGKPGPLLKALMGWFNRKPLMELVRRMLRTLRISLAVQGRMGLGDPADTAIAITAMRQLDAQLKHVRLQVVPEYEDDVLDLAGFFSARIWLVHVALVFVAALFNREIRRAVWALR